MAIKYKWLAEKLKDVMKGNMEKGIDKLPSENTLCTRYHVSRQTVRQSLALLEQEGLIEKRQGSGSYATGLSAITSENRIGILITDTQNYLYPALLADIESTLSVAGYHSEIHETKNQIYIERTLLTSLLGNPPRGLIVEPVRSTLPNPNLDLYRELQHRGCVLVFLHHSYEDLLDVPCVKDANYQGSALLVQHLLQQGHTKIGGIFLSDMRQGAERYLGFIETMQNHRLSVPDERVLWLSSKEQTLLREQQKADFLKDYIRTCMSECTAVICFNDEIAYWFGRELIHEGYQLPQEMSIVAFDNSYLSNADWMTFTTLTHQPHETGTTVAKLMIDRLKGLSVGTKELSWTLITRESSSSHPQES